MSKYLLLAVAALMMQGCLDSTRPPTGLERAIEGKPIDTAKLNRAEAYLTNIEEDLARYAGLAPQERRDAEIAMEPRLERAVELATETRLENKAIYYLANWRYTYQEGEGVDVLLTRLAGLGSPAFKAAGDRLQVLLRLRQGRVVEAKQMAQALVERIPEFQPVMELVTFHEFVGSAAPTLKTRNLTGGSEEPVTERSEAYLFYLFIHTLDDQAIYLINRYLDAIAVLPTSERRLVCVTFDANLLSATTRVRSLPRSSELELLWVNPNQGGNAGEWIKAWKLPSGSPHIALLGPGPNRAVMAVEMTPEALGKLLKPGSTALP